MRRPSSSLLAAAFLSGMGALALQMTWTRRLAVGLGHETPAVLGVVTAFFAGLALGGWLGGRWMRAGIRPSRLAAGIELAIAAWAAATVPWIAWLDAAVPSWRGDAGGAGRAWFLAAVVPLAALLPTTLALGATFPVVERWLASLGTVGSAGRYYAANTLGAAAGVVVSLAWVQPAFGLSGTTLGAAALHVAAAALFFRAGAAGDGADVAPRRDVPATRGTAWPWIAALAATGFLGIGFEVLAMRGLSMVLGGTVYSAATTLGLWLLGTSAGAAAWTRWRGRIDAALPWMAVASVVAASRVLAWLPAWMESRRSAWGDGFGATTAAELLGAAMALVPATLVFGAWFPSLVSRAVDAGAGAGVAVAANTAGGAVAPLLVGAALFPSLGSRGAWIAVAAGYGVVAAAMAARRTAGTRAVGIAAVLAALAAVPSDLTLSQGPPGARRTWVDEGAGETAAVWEFPDGNRALAVNNRFSMGGTASTNAASRHAHLPLLLHPGPRRAAFLGLGTGISFAAAGAHPGLEADGVELSPGVARAMPWFAPHNALAPGLRVVVADARTFVRATPRRYDVIVADLFHPDRDGAGWLYTREHFAAIRSRLEPGGIACQWLPWFQLDATARDAIVSAWLAEFPGSEAWMLRWTTVDTPVLGLVGRAEGGAPGMPRRVGSLDAGLRARLRDCGLGDDWQVWGCWLGPAAGLVPSFPVRIAPSTDDRPSVGWLAARNADQARRQCVDEWLTMLRRMAGNGGPEWPGPDRARWGRFRAARDAYVGALASAVAGRTAESEAALWSSVRASEDFPSAYSHLLGESMAEMRSNPGSARDRLRRLAEARPEKPVAGELLRRLEGR